MQFARSLRERIQSGEITCTIRIWTRPHVKVGGRYPLPPGEVEVESIQQMTLAEITPALARQSGFNGVVALLKTVAQDPGDTYTPA